MKIYHLVSLSALRDVEKFFRLCGPRMTQSNKMARKFLEITKSKLQKKWLVIKPRLECLKRELILILTASFQRGARWGQLSAPSNLAKIQRILECKKQFRKTWTTLALLMVNHQTLKFSWPFWNRKKCILRIPETKIKITKNDDDSWKQIIIIKFLI